jgi:hypothetical protein
MTSGAGRLPRRKTFLTGFRPRAHVSTVYRGDTRYRKARSRSPHSTIPTPTESRNPNAWSPLEASINSWIAANIVQ